MHEKLFINTKNFQKLQRLGQEWTTTILHTQIQIMKQGVGHTYLLATMRIKTPAEVQRWNQAKSENIDT